jgi:dihydroorotate dehydrogenase
LLFRLPPHLAHAFAAFGLRGAYRARALSWLAPPLRVRPEERVQTMGLTFPHAVGLAGGFDKDAKVAGALAALGFAHLELGTVTAQPQHANPAPNLFRLPRDRALINRLGFPNDGAVAVAERIRRLRGRREIAVPIGVSIGKSRVIDPEDTDAVVRDYVTALCAVEPVADFVVVNVSSPNTQGLRGLQAPAIAQRLFLALADARRAPRATPCPLLVKVAPDLSDDGVRGLLDAAMGAGFAGVVATNTTLGRQGLATAEAEVLAMGAGGLSGPPVFRRALEVVKLARAHLGPGPTVIGVGGLSSAEDARAMRDAGATLGQVYTAFIYQGPRVIDTLRSGFAR